MLKKNLKLASGSAALLMAGLTGAAQASVNVQSFSPVANSTYTLTEDALLEVSPGDTTWNGRRLFFGATYNYLSNPLIEWNETRTERVGTLVDNVNTLDLTVGLFLNRRLSVNFDAPLNLVRTDGSASQFSFGDSRAFLKYRLTPENSIVAFSIIPELRLPTGSGDLFLSDGSVAPGILLAFERDFGAVRASANIGYRYSSEAVYQDLEYKQRMPMALGLYIPINAKWGANVEAAGSLVLPTNRFNNPGEFYAGARYQWASTASFTGGVSTGGLSSGSGNEARIVFGVKFSPMPEAPAPIAPAPVVAPVVVAPIQPIKKAEAPKRVIFTAKEIKITEEIKFKHASDVLTDSGRKLLDEVADVMKKNRRSYKKILIAGHTNELGTYPYNQKLSEKRAASVREYLISRGILGKELMTIGYGKTKPKRLAGMSRDAKLAANRRVEFNVIN